MFMQQHAHTSNDSGMGGHTFLLLHLDSYDICQAYMFFRKHRLSPSFAKARNGPGPCPWGGVRAFLKEKKKIRAGKAVES